jgi:hypothetical protein
MQVDNLKLRVLDKVISISDKHLLEKIDELIGNVDLEEAVFKINEGQRQMLLNSDQDILENKIISDEKLNEEEDKWLNG